MLQNSKRIQSQLFTVESQESQDFLGYSVSPSLASGYQGPGFYSMCHAASSAYSLTWAWGNGAVLSLYTALSLHKAVPPCLRKEHGDPLFFLSLPVFAFAQLGILFSEVTMAAGVHGSPPCARDPLMLWQQGLMSVWLSFPLPAVWWRDFQIYLTSCLPRFN